MQSIIDPAHLDARVDALMASFVEPGGPGAAVAILRDGQFILRKAYGLADLEWETPLSPDCVFRICSMTKQFTAVAVMMLAEQGRLDVDAPVETFLPDWPTQGRRVSVAQLMNHTSGIWRHDSGLIERTLRKNPPPAEVLDLIAAQPFEFEPGERYEYNNSGYLLLGAIIAAVSGRSYEAFLRDAIFDPLGMAETRVLTHGTIVPRRARGFVHGRAGFHNARLDAMSWSGAAGALGSTVDDLAKWDAALRADRLVTRQTLERMLKPTVMTDGSVFPYGFGWGLADYAGRRVMHHTGGISGFGCQMAAFRDEALTTIVLSNLYLFPFDQVTRGLMRAALDLPEPAPKITGLPEASLATCAGTFKAHGIPVRTLAIDDGALVFRDEPGRPRLLPVTADRFVEAGDREIDYVFSEPRDGVFQSFEMRSPLWPPTGYRRVASAGDRG